MKILSVCPNSFAANTYLLISKNQAFVIDPSVSVSSIERLLKQNNAELVGILLTHGHFDHTVSVDTLRNKFAIPLMIHPGDAPMLTNGKINGFYHFYEQECTHRPAERLIDDGDELTLGDESLKVIGTPGHSPGSVCFLCEDDSKKQFMLTGDTLFADSVGRCDLWGGSTEEIRNSLIKLRAYDGSMMMYAGHGPSSTLGSALESAKYFVDF